MYYKVSHEPNGFQDIACIFIWCIGFSKQYFTSIAIWLIFANRKNDTSSTGLALIWAIFSMISSLLDFKLGSSAKTKWNIFNFTLKFDLKRYINQSAPTTWHNHDVQHNNLGISKTEIHIVNSMSHLTEWAVPFTWLWITISIFMAENVGDECQSPWKWFYSYCERVKHIILRINLA